MNKCPPPPNSCGECYACNSAYKKDPIGRQKCICKDNKQCLANKNYCKDCNLCSVSTSNKTKAPKKFICPGNTDATVWCGDREYNGTSSTCPNAWCEVNAIKVGNKHSCPTPDSFLNCMGNSMKEDGRCRTPMCRITIKPVESFMNYESKNFSKYVIALIFILLLCLYGMGK